jgi:hypothetical protein
VRPKVESGRPCSHRHLIRRLAESCREVRKLGARLGHPRRKAKADQRQTLRLEMPCRTEHTTDAPVC